MGDFNGDGKNEIAYMIEDGGVYIKPEKNTRIRDYNQAENGFAIGDYKDYLLSLDMSSEIGAFSAAHSERITQLINKTNQFNFTTRRYTQGEVDAIVADKENYISAYAKLVDKFGDNGITQLFIASVEDKTATIDLWVMSCRVFKRHFEFAVFDYFVKQCAARGITTVNASYLPTAKNVIIKDFYEELGLTLVREEDGAKYYTYTIPADKVLGDITIEFSYGEPILEVAITDITAPEVLTAPDYEATAGADSYTIDSVVWEPEVAVDGTFDFDTAYTVKVTVSAKDE